jgi:hypothetical protein
VRVELRRDHLAENVEQPLHALPYASLLSRCRQNRPVPTCGGGQERTDCALNRGRTLFTRRFLRKPRREGDMKRDFAQDIIRRVRSERSHLSKTLGLGGRCGERARAGSGRGLASACTIDGSDPTSAACCRHRSRLGRGLSRLGLDPQARHKRSAHTVQLPPTQNVLNHCNEPVLSKCYHGVHVELCRMIQARDMVAPSTTTSTCSVVYLFDPARRPILPLPKLPVCEDGRRKDRRCLARTLCEEL